MTQSLALSQFETALKVVESDSATPAEKAEMLMEIAMGMQTRPKTAEPPPWCLSADTANSRVIADFGNNRVLLWPLAPELTP